MKTIKPIITEHSHLTKKEKSEQFKQECLDVMHENNIGVVELPSALQKIADEEGDRNDLQKLGDTKDLSFALLLDRASGMLWKEILNKYRCRWSVYNMARVRSATFKKMGDFVEEGLKAMRIARTEDSMFQLANGETRIEKGMMPPDVKAADLYLRGNDSRYREEKEQQATQVVINLGGGLGPQNTSR